ncbi:MAG: type VI secretion system tube protein Hcp [Candidatus Sericytochromatia bacterium]
MLATAALWALAGCTAPAAAPPTPQAPIPVDLQALESSVSLGLGARDFYMTITRKEGPVKEGTETRLRCQSYSYNVKTPRDAASGQATGRRQHQPITIVKEWGASSPHLMKALATSEVIPRVLLEFPRNTTNPEGERAMDIFMTIELTNVVVVGLTQVTGDATNRAACPSGDCVSPRELEEIQLVCQKATFTSTQDKTTAVDDWTR